MTLSHDADFTGENGSQELKVKGALDELFVLAKKYNSSEAYLELMRFIARFRSYSPFNAMLIHLQMPGARFVATPNRWRSEYGRTIKVTARPIVILQPMGPVLFVFDVAETEPVPGAPTLPVRIEQPLFVGGMLPNGKYEHTVTNAKRDGVRATEQAFGSRIGGSIQRIHSAETMDFWFGVSAHTVPVRYELLLNRNLSTTARYAVLIHELAHLYCGHQGTPDQRWWPDRTDLSLAVREFEAESVSWLICSRMGIENRSEQYLAAYVRRYESTPPISLDAVLKASWLIERMGRASMPPRK